MAGRGRGGGGLGGRGGLKGATWEHDPKLTLDSRPTDLFPRHPNLKAPKAPTGRELRQIEHYKNVRNRIHRGPLYTQPSRRDMVGMPVKTFSEDQFNKQYATDSKADMDPFTGVETYSQRMAGKTNTIPKLKGRPFDLTLFPKELWSTLEGKSGDAVRAHLDLAAQKQGRKLNGVKDTAADADADARIQAMMERIHKLDDEEDEDEEGGEEEDADSEYDDDDMGGDYDGERYFDNGEEDDDGDGGGGEDEY